MNKIENIIQKYNLPPLNELYAEFGLFDPEEEEDFIKLIIKKLSEKVEIYTKFLEDILQPDSTIISMNEAEVFDNVDRKKIFEILKMLVYYQRLSLEVELNCDDKKRANYFKEFLEKWKKVKPNLIPIIKKATDVWKKQDNEKKIEGYFG